MPGSSWTASSSRRWSSRSARRGTVTTPYVNTIPKDEPWFPGDEDLERRIRAYIRWNAAVMVVRANKHADGIGGHLSTFASLGRAVRGRVQPLLPRQGRRPPRRPRLHPGPRRARASTAGRSSRVASTRPSSTGSAEERRSAGPVARTPTRGSCPTSGSTRRSRWGSGRSCRSTRPASTSTCTTVASTTPADVAGVVLPRRRRGRRARDAGLDLPGRSRAARQPDLGRQLQPAAARRPGARQRQDHPGARGDLPRRRLERHQGRVGRPLGRAARRATSTACCSTR